MLSHEEERRRLSAVGPAMRGCRMRRKLTREQVEEATGITTGTLGRWERGQAQPEVMDLWRLADLYGVSIGELTGTGPADPIEEQRQVELGRRDYPAVRG